MNEIYVALVLTIAFIITVSLLICITKNIFNIVKICKNKGAPFNKLKLTEYIANIEIDLFAIFLSIILSYILITEGVIMDLWIEIAVNVGCSLLVSVVITLIAYFKFLKHIPEETEKKINNLLNDRLGYETTNHNAVIQKADTAEYRLSKEHSEIKESINLSNRELSSLSQKLDSEKELKTLRYEYLKDNDRSIVNCIEKISALGESLEKLNYENLKLKAENQELLLENQELKSKLNQENNFTPKMHL